MRLAMVLCVCLGLAACEAGGDSPTLPDADLSKPMCTGVVYDSCTTPAGCASGNCKLFEDALIQVCTQACSAAMPCPNDASGMPGTCNNRGICKPRLANACHP